MSAATTPRPARSGTATLGPVEVALPTNEAEDWAINYAYF
ncbi:hypothetical protein CAURIS_10710 [Corynebacterium auris]|uniref:Uncharacterized protein n=1 Tax=Corynebacterium timonense TaxID=441500 RepID=A0A1H1UZJ7_9CORY|nr:hypothetical protein CAURIS_10710 [Corynebacterium auris]SDS77964.1 hypothetical protein SAMN04488539_2375 [Corynebacterium timonense]